jgi:hypothetical protein
LPEFIATDIVRSNETDSAALELAMRSLLCALMIAEARLEAPARCQSFGGRDQGVEGPAFGGRGQGEWAAVLVFRRLVAIGVSRSGIRRRVAGTQNVGLR